MTFTASLTRAMSPVLWPPDQKLLHENRQRVIYASGAGTTATDSITLLDLHSSGWHRLSGPTTRRIREQHPETGLVYAIYDIADLKRPGMPLATNDGYWLDAAQHAKDRGDAVVISVAADGTVEGLHVCPSVTEERLVEAARCASHDTWRIAAALLEMLVLRDAPFRFTPAETARLREGHNPAEPIYLLYDWRNLSRPIKVYSLSHVEWAGRRSRRYHHLLIGLPPDGHAFGIESGPGREVTFVDVLQVLESRSGGAPDANALAVLGATLLARHYDAAYELTKACCGDHVTPSDVPEEELLVEVRRKYAVASMALSDKPVKASRPDGCTASAETQKSVAVIAREKSSQTAF